MRTAFGTKVLSLAVAVTMAIGLLGTDAMTVYAAPTDAVEAEGEETTALTGKIEWNDYKDKDEMRPSHVNVYLLADGNEQAMKSLSEADNWEFSFTGLQKTDGEEEIEYTVSIDEPIGYQVLYSDAGSNTVITAVHKPGETSLPVKVIWNDSRDADGIRPESVTARLMFQTGQGEEASEVVNAELSDENGWAYSFTGVSVSDTGYSVEIDGLPEGYTTRTTGSIRSGFEITNTHEAQAKTSADATVMKDIDVHCIWDDADNNDGMRPEEISIVLSVKEGSPGMGETDYPYTDITSQTVSEDTGWACVFRNLPKYKDGEEVVYSVSAAGEDGRRIDNYEIEISENVITLSHVPETIDIYGSKTWDSDGVSEKPEKLTVYLKNDGRTVRTAQLTEENNWSFDFEDLPKYENGKQIKYVVQEENGSIFKTVPDGELEVNTSNDEVDIASILFGDGEEMDEAAEETEDGESETKASDVLAVIFGIIILVVIVAVVYHFTANGENPDAAAADENPDINNAQ